MLELRKFFTPNALAESLGRLPELKSPIMDTFFTDRRNHPLPVLGLDDLGVPVTNVPVIKRGTRAYEVDRGGNTISAVEPAPIEIASFLGAKELNDLKMLDQTGQQTYIDNRIDDQRRIARRTTEALCAQAMTGNLSYKMATLGGLVDYTMDYGSVGSFTPSTKWDSNGVTIKNIILDLAKGTQAIQKWGFGSQVEYYVGFDVFALLVDKIAALPNSATAVVTADAIVLGGLKIHLMSTTYMDLGTKQSVPVIPPKTVLAVDLLGGTKLFYCALDDLEANLQPLPFFVNPDQTKNPSGWNLIGKSKPFPAPNVKAIAKATVLS
jgi:hypothetical protein